MEINYDKLWNEIDAVVQVDYGKKLPHEKSLHELATSWGMSEKRAKEIIDKLIAERKLMSREVIAKNGRRAIAYSPTSEK